MPIGVPELLIILAIVLVLVGPKRLPGLGRQIGGGIREFTSSVRRRQDEVERGDDPSDAGPRGRDDRG